MKSSKFDPSPYNNTNFRLRNDLDDFNIVLMGCNVRDGPDSPFFVFFRNIHCKRCAKKTKSIDFLLSNIEKEAASGSGRKLDVQTVR